MKISVQLDFKDIKTDTSSLIDNIYESFCVFYVDITESINIEELYKYVYEEIKQTGKGTFVAKKDDIFFEVVINWKKSQVDVQSIEGQKQADLVFYVERCLEICSNFAMFELEASEDGFHTMGEHWAAL